MWQKLTIKSVTNWRSIDPLFIDVTQTINLFHNKCNMKLVSVEAKEDVRGSRLHQGAFSAFVCKTEKKYNKP
jgi:hypothetical protein